MGKEPLWDEKNPCPPFGAKGRSDAWMTGSRWYDYFYKSKDHIPIVLKYAEEELGYSKKDVATLKKLPAWKLGIHCGSWIRLFYRGWIYEDKYVERMKVKIADYLVEAKALEKVLDEQKEKEPKRLTHGLRLTSPSIDREEKLLAAVGIKDGVSNIYIT